MKIHGAWLGRKFAPKSALSKKYEGFMLFLLMSAWSDLTQKIFNISFSRIDESDFLCRDSETPLGIFQTLIACFKHGNSRNLVEAKIRSQIVSDMSKNSINPSYLLHRADLKQIFAPTKFREFSCLEHALKVWKSQRDVLESLQRKFDLSLRENEFLNILCLKSVSSIYTAIHTSAVLLLQILMFLTFSNKSPKNCKIHEKT